MGDIRGVGGPRFNMPQSEEVSADSDLGNVEHKEAGPKAPAKKGSNGPKLPEDKVGDYRVPLPQPKRETEDTYERGTNREDDQDRLDRSRPRDERDLDPKQKQQLDKEKLDPHKKVVDDQLKKGIKEAEEKGNKNWVKEREREQMDDMIRKQKFRVRP